MWIVFFVAVLCFISTLLVMFGLLLLVCLEWLAFSSVSATDYMNFDHSWMAKSNFSIHYVTDKTELKRLLFNKQTVDKYNVAYCSDTEPRIIFIGAHMNFTESARITNVSACPYETESGVTRDSTTEQCSQMGQLLVKSTNKSCVANADLVMTKMSEQGRMPLIVGSNKILVADPQTGSLRGVGLMLRRSVNVLVKGVCIQGINPHVFNGGDAVYITNSMNVMFVGNHIKDIGGYFINTYGECNHHISIHSNIFDGTSKFSAY